MTNGTDPQYRRNFPVKDQTRFLGIVKARKIELESEINRLKDETYLFMKNNKQYITLRKIAKDLSQEVDEYENELEDHNMARMNSFRDVKELKKEIDDLHAHNQQLQLTIDNMSLENQRQEQRIQQLNDEFYDERSSMTEQVEKMNVADLTSSSHQVQNELVTLEYQLNHIRMQASASPLQQEALSLIDQLCELEITYEQLLNENNILPTQTEDDNFDFTLIEQSENLDEIYETCLNDIKTVQKSNLISLSFISQRHAQINSNQYAIEKEYSKNTLTILAEQHKKLKDDFRKLETLDHLLTDELKELKLKYTKMQEDLIKFYDLEKLKRNAERRKQQLITDKINMLKQKQITQIELQNLQSQVDTLQTQLQNHQTHQQLINLEQKLQNLLTLDSSSNFQNDYEQIKTKALELVRIHNQWLIERLKSQS